MAVTFLLVFPLTQVIVIFLAAGFAVAVCEGVGVTTGSAAWLNLTLMLGVENVNPPAVIFSQPSFSEITVVATEGVPSELDTSIFA
jgi:hypothetical protein